MHAGILPRQAHRQPHFAGSLASRAGIEHAECLVEAIGRDHQVFFGFCLVNEDRSGKVIITLHDLFQFIFFELRRCFVGQFSGQVTALGGWGGAGSTARKDCEAQRHVRDFSKHQFPPEKGSNNGRLLAV